MSSTATPCFEVLKDSRGLTWGYYVRTNDTVVIPGYKPMPASLFRPAPPPKPKPTIRYLSLPTAIGRSNLCHSCYVQARKKTVDTVDAGRKTVLECPSCHKLMAPHSLFS
jgi:hypothetical protein